MKQIQRWMMSLFALSASQANGIFVLLPLLLLFMISDPAWRWWRAKTWEPDHRDTAELDSIAEVWRLAIHDTSSASRPVKAYHRNISMPAERFIFDPNKVGLDELIRLGFRERLAQRIVNYRARGGTFKSKGDLLKIYGMDTAQYNRVAAYMRIVPATGASEADFVNKPERTHQRRLAVRSRQDPFDINQADTARLEAVAGIGEKLSRRIIKYRSSLGGFVDITQLQEVFGLDSAVAAELGENVFVAPDFLPHRININTADEKTLEEHPYLSRQEARAIVAYRFQHGAFQTVSDLRKLPMFNDGKVRQIEPYLMAVE